MFLRKQWHIFYDSIFVQFPYINFGIEFLFLFGFERVGPQLVLCRHSADHVFSKRTTRESGFSRFSRIITILQDVHAFKDFKFFF